MCHDLLCGITPWHIRRLCDNAWEGGYNFTPNEVGRMSLDMVVALLIDRDLLRNRQGVRTRTVSAVGNLPEADADGFIRGRDAQGNPIKARIGGESLATQARKAHEAGMSLKQYQRAKRREERRKSKKQART